MEVQSLDDKEVVTDVQFLKEEEEAEEVAVVQSLKKVVAGVQYLKKEVEVEQEAGLSPKAEQMYSGGKMVVMDVEEVVLLTQLVPKLRRQLDQLV